MFDTIFDFATIILLAVTIAYSWKLNQRLALLTNEKSPIAENLESFTNATETAVIAVEELHVRGEEICKMIDEKIKKAQQIGDEIEILTSRVDRKVAEIRPTRAVAPTTEAAEVPKTLGGKISTSHFLKALKDKEFKEALFG
jgi:mevalonate kinase